MTQPSAVRLEQGGITIDATDTSVPLVAASYTHPALPNRTIVRLVPEALVKAEDLALGVTGLIPATESTSATSAAGRSVFRPGRFSPTQPTRTTR